MNEKLIRELGRGQRSEILTVLKRQGGMSVKELAAHFHLSYMGLKGPCLDLEKEGYLDTFRRPVALGRPELVYRLTRRSHELFPGGNNHFTSEILEAVQQAYGPAAPTKLLFSLFAQKVKAYRARIASPDLFERAACLARLRDADGYMAEFDPGNPASGPLIVEYGSPIRDLFHRYPILERLERELFEQVLNCPVRREQDASMSSGVYRCNFHLGTKPR